MTGNSVIAAVPVSQQRTGAGAAAAARPGERPVWRPVAGDVLPLKVIDATPGAWVVEVAPGVQWRLLDLPGARALLSTRLLGLPNASSSSASLPDSTMGLASGLSTQTVLRARVVTSFPRVTLQLLSEPPASTGQLPPLREDAAALRLDPTVFHRIAWRELDPLALTRAWEVLLQRYGQGLLRQDQAGYLPLGFAPVPLPPWTFPVYAWGGLSVSLSVRDDEDGASSPRRVRRHSLLRLSMVLPGLGKVEAQIQALATGISLRLAAESQAAARALEAALPAIAAVLAQAALPLVHWHVGADLQAGLQAGLQTIPGWAETAASGARAAPPVSLLRAGAEIVAALSRRWPPRMP